MRQPGWKIKRCKQHCAASGEMSPIGPFKQCEMPLRERLGRQQQPALFNITTLISTLGDYPRAPRSHAAYSNQAHSTKPPLLGPQLSYSHWLVLCCSIYGELLAGVVLSAFCDVSLRFSGLRWRESAVIVDLISCDPETFSSIFFIWFLSVFYELIARMLRVFECFSM